MPSVSDMSSVTLGSSNQQKKNPTTGVASPCGRRVGRSRSAAPRCSHKGCGSSAISNEESSNIINWNPSTPLLHVAPVNHIQNLHEAHVCQITGRAMMDCERHDMVELDDFGVYPLGGGALPAYQITRLTLMLTA